MKIVIKMKNLTLPELKREKQILMIKLAIIQNLIKTPFSKREQEIKEIEQIVKKHFKK